MHIKIYIHNKPLYLCDVLEDEHHLLLHQPDTVFIDDLDSHSVKAMIREMNLPEIQTGIFLHDNLEELKKAFFKKFERIKAGGGLVLNEADEILMIFRRGFWDLPKGKLDKGETIEECAVREVREETGLKNVKLKKPLMITYHTYEQGTHHIIKQSHWFLMKAKKAEPLVAQTAEDITEIKWVKRDDLLPFEIKAYPSIVDVLHVPLKEK